MKKFIAIYTGSSTSPQGERWAALDEKTRNERMQAGMKAWHQWYADHAGIVGAILKGRDKRVPALLFPQLFECLAQAAVGRYAAGYAEVFDARFQRGFFELG